MWPFLRAFFRLSLFPLPRHGLPQFRIISEAFLGPNLWAYESAARGITRAPPPTCLRPQPARPSAKWHSVVFRFGIALNWRDGENRSDEYGSGSWREVERLRLYRDAIPAESVSRSMFGRVQDLMS